mmetsp:Transcript_5808/g.7602  ORF Transcript_5808/g.7602 Transcript_5808/m.7602 type:complete len:249 (+) Transcript_5808:87-833(+)|eukprot:CAMPEP_0198138984 /NCGR_PEP_ID=MMETSP1443-20131203/2320_1 /TAXON_ID=186043 /ORGANISM="Entomoneis sp., Strain CCMP2396" /LENGTH=248 /DNA_ID=CAMNT_0043800943 /DNA_START=20 /DNA_END=769 /DNA_ORIENTATION=+
MTAQDIVRIVVTVAIAQFACNLIAHWRIFSKEFYERAVGAYERAKWKKDKAAKDAEELGIDIGNKGSSEEDNAAAGAANKTSGKQKSNNKVGRATKTWERAEQDCNDAAANVSRRHLVPNFLTSILFVILMRVMGTEYKGNIMAVLPFAPWPFFQKITARGLDFGSSSFSEYDNDNSDSSSSVTGTGQAASFMFIYMLTGLSVKYYVNKMFGSKPPPGADGMMNLTQSSWGKKMLASAGIDAKDLKME